MASPFRVAFCVSGNGNLFRSAVLQHANIGIDPVLIILDQNANSDLEDFSTAHGIQCKRLSSSPRLAFDAAIRDSLIQARPDLISLTFDWLLPPETVTEFSHQIINVHPALLPAFPGKDALQHTSRDGCRYGGATIHEVDEGIDTGSIIAQCVLGLRRDETPDLFGRRLFCLLRLMFLQVLSWYSEGRVQHADDGRIWIRDAVYGEFPISPAVENAFPDV